MNIHVVAFTKKGLALARSIARGLDGQGEQVVVAATERIAPTGEVRAVPDLLAWTKDAFAHADALLFVGACGIATRAIAPYVSDKFRDPAVVCVDEGATYAIPLLSGHVGGANDLARRVAALCGARPAITTATDVNAVFAVDAWARKSGLVVVERDLAKRVSATLLEGGEVGFVSAWPARGELPKGLVTPASTPILPELGIAVGNDLSAEPFSKTLHLVARTVVVGVGCKRGTSAANLARAVDACLEHAHVPASVVVALASIDVKRDEEGLRALACERGWDARFFSAEELARVPGTFHESAFVERTVGVSNVCERAACAADATLIQGRWVRGGVTVALAERTPALAFPGEGARAVAAGSVACVGLGPGGADDLTLRAHKVLCAAEVIVGYGTYVDLVRKDYPCAEFVTTPMRQEVERCRMALERAQRGQRVALVCSGDPGVYGMAGLLLELSCKFEGVDVRIVPGVTAATGGAALLGAPLMHDWCCISLSDLMTPWEVIEKRLRAAAQADFCVCLYNPGSRGRAQHLRRACDVLLEHRDPSTVCGIVHKAGREGEAHRLLSLGELREASVTMQTCVFVGNSSTRVVNGRMVTPRGYERKRV